MKIGRNALCPCGSGRKYKKCHLGREDELFAPRSPEAPPMDIPKTVPGVGDALREAEHFWKECVRTYNDPEAFRVNLNALIQAVRNITFRVQSGKSGVANFDSWYLPWRDFLQTNALMRWLNEARIAVVKKSGLDTRSTATVRLIYSYLDAAEISLKDLPAGLPNDELASALAKTVPPELLGNSAIEIERRWEVDELPGIELLDALADAIRVLLGLVRDLDLYLRTGDALSPPEEIATLTPMPASLRRTRESRRLRINPESGVQYEHGELFVPTDPALNEIAARRYKMTPGAIPRSDDPLEVARAIFPIAARMLKRDGHHTPFLFLHHPERGWHTRQIVMEDKLDKFLIWRRIGEEAEDEGYDGAVFVSEAWVASPDTISGPYGSLEHAPGRMEHLSVSAASKDGRRLDLEAQFHRRLGRISRVDPPFELTPKGPWFMSPLERVWERQGGQGEPGQPDAE